MRCALSISLSACLALTACAAKPKPDLRLPVAYEANQPAQANVALDRWWEVFDDPQLTALIEQSFVANPDAKTAAARLREARASRVSALTQYLPQGGAAGSATRSDTDQIQGGVPPELIPLLPPGISVGGVSKSYSASFDVSWEIDLFGRLWATRRVANADVAAARLDYEATRASLAAQVADAYFQARGFAIQLEDARESERIQRELYELAAKRAEVGIAATSEPDRVAGDLARSEAQVAALEAELQAQRRTLLILAGRTSEPTSSVDTPPDVALPPEIPTTLPSDLLRRRPDVLRAEAELAGAVGRQDLARLALLPTFTLRPGYGWQRTEQAGRVTENSTWSIGGAVSQPILDIPNLLAQIRVSDARTQAAAADYERAVQTAFSESEGALVRLAADRRRVSVLTDGEVRAERAYRAARRGYELGLTDLQETLSSELSWRATRAQLTTARVDAVRRAVQAFKAVGGGWAGATAAQPHAAGAPQGQTRDVTG